MHRKKARFRMVDGPECQEAPNDVENEEQEKRPYIVAFVWPRGRSNRPYTEIVPKKHGQTYQEAGSIASTAASNDAKTQCDHFGRISAEFRYDTLVRELVQHLPAASYRTFLNLNDAKALLQQFCRKNCRRIDKNRGRSQRHAYTHVFVRHG